VLRLLEKEPARRYQTGDDLARELEELLARAGPSWDSQLEVPRDIGDVGVTRADADVPLGAGLLLSKDDLGPAPVPVDRVPISIRSFEPRNLLSVDRKEPAAPAP